MKQRACGPVTTVALRFVPASQIQKLASILPLIQRRTQMASCSGQAEVAYIHLAASAAVERTVVTHGWSIWVNRRTKSLSSFSSSKILTIRGLEQVCLRVEMNERSTSQNSDCCKGYQISKRPPGNSPYGVLT